MNTNAPARSVLPLLMLLSLAACEEVPAQQQLRSLDYNCPRWQCGYNTSEINGRSLRELNLDGVPNESGVALVGFEGPPGLVGYELELDGDELVAHSSLPFMAPLRGPALIGSVLQLELDGQLSLPVVIAGYEEVESWAAGSPPVAAYSLTHADVDQPLLERSVCKGTLIDPLQASVVILAEERYDAQTKAVLPDQDQWFTLACAGSAAAKMALLGYGPNGDLDGEGAATVAQRQATLNMLTANYCGDGHAYTADGTPLMWENQGGSVSLTGSTGASEAVWDASGALCLDTPRLVDRSEVGCALPTCAELFLDDGEWMTHATPQSK